MQGNCTECVWYDQCGGSERCEHFFFAGEEPEYPEELSELHMEFFNDFQIYLKEFYE